MTDLNKFSIYFINAWGLQLEFYFVNICRKRAMHQPAAGKLVLEVQANKLVVLDIDETPISRAWHVVALNRGNHSAAAEAFRYFVLEHGAKILGELNAAGIP